jgi:outer membrane lipoprotein-sorting protein
MSGIEERLRRRLIRRSRPWAAKSPQPVPNKRRDRGQAEHDMGSRIGSRTGGVAALLSSLALASVGWTMLPPGAAFAQSAPQTVPMPVPAPQPKSHATPAAPRPPAAVTPTAQQQRAPEPAASGFPSIFPKPPALFGGSGEATATAFDARQRALADRVSAYLSNVRQLHGNFVQVGPDGSKSEGEFYLQKPGKVRFDYNPPSPIELIADGSSVVVRDRKLATQDLYPLSQTPLRFLLADRIDLMRDTNLIGVYADDVFVTVVIEERQIIAGTHRLMLMFGAQDYQLRQWTVTDPQGLDTTVAVYNLDTKQQPDPNMFRIDYTRQIQ